MGIGVILYYNFCADKSEVIKFFFFLFLLKNMLQKSEVSDCYTKVIDSMCKRAISNVTLHGINNYYCMMYYSFISHSLFTISIAIEFR